MSKLKNSKTCCWKEYIYIYLSKLEDAFSCHVIWFLWTFQLPGVSHAWSFRESWRRASHVKSPHAFETFVLFIQKRTDSSCHKSRLQNNPIRASSKFCHGLRDRKWSAFCNQTETFSCVTKMWAQDNALVCVYRSYKVQFGHLVLEKPANTTTKSLSMFLNGTLRNIQDIGNRSTEKKLEMLGSIVSCLASSRKILGEKKIWGENFFEHSGWHKTSRNA